MSAGENSEKLITAAAVHSNSNQPSDTQPIRDGRCCDPAFLVVHLSRGTDDKANPSAYWGFLEPKLERRHIALRHKTVYRGCFAPVDDIGELRHRQLLVSAAQDATKLTVHWPVQWFLYAQVGFHSCTVQRCLDHRTLPT